MGPLRYRIEDKRCGFESELTHIRDNCYALVDSQFVTIVLEHDDSLECHDISRSAICKCVMKQIMEQPVCKAADESLVRILMDSVRNRTIKDSKNTKDLRRICKAYTGNHYIRKVYDSYKASVYAFLYSVRGGDTEVCLQVVNYGSRTINGSFSVDLDIFDRVYSMV